ncbi:MAG: S8 family serine peptidase [Anaerolineae bacterium]|nr:S8 family serine peptidase [Anaerolineae bacterium]
MMAASRRLFVINLAIVAILVVLAGPARSAAIPPAGKRVGVEQGDREGLPTFLVYLAEQADLRPAYRVRDWERRGWFVLDALRETARRTQPPLLAALEDLRAAGQVAEIHPHYARNAIVVRGERQVAAALGRMAGVAAVYPAPPVIPVAPLETAPAGTIPEAVEWNVQQIRANQVWSTYGITGQGIVVANIDSGVEYVHPALVNQYRGNLGGGVFQHDYNWWDPSDQYDYPAPISGPYPLGSSHGTHTMGVIVGDDGGANQIGVAPDAEWIAAYGFSGIDGLLSAVEWMIAPWQVNDFDPSHPTADPAQRPHAVNNSWGAPGGLMMFNDLLEVYRAAGIYATFAAGNNGENGCGTMISPADNPAGFSVGATDPFDNIAYFSSRGPNALRPWVDQYGTGPEVSAPGYGVRTSHPGGNYVISGGTSYASPHVAGTVALLWAAEPDLVGQVEETAELLRRTAVPRTTGEMCGGVPGSEVPNNTYGWGRLDALAAVEMIWRAGSLAGTVADAASGDPIPTARLLAYRDGYTLTTTTDPTGTCSLLLGQGTYTVTVQAYGYQPQVVGGIAVTQDATTTVDITLTPRLTHTLSGVVTGVGPVGARIGIRGTPVELSGDPASGAYSATVAAGAYALRVTARGHVPQERPITVTGALTENFVLQPRQTYYVRDSRSPCGPAFDWIDATDGTAYTLDFQSYVSIYDPAYPFPFYGADNVFYYPSSNGLVTFGQGHPAHVQDLPTVVVPFEGVANNAIYGYADMLNPAGGGQGTVYYQVLDDRYVVIEYYQVEHWPSGAPETFEFVLDTATGAILLQYLEVSQPDWGTVGVEGPGGADGLLYSYANSAGITDTLAVGFYPVWGSPPADQGPGGAWGTLSGTVTVSGTAVPVPGATVTATTFLRTLTATADADGRYIFADVCADRYELRAGAPGYGTSSAVEARLHWPGDVAVTDLLLPPPTPVLTLSKTSVLAQIQPGGWVTYSLVYANQGEAALAQVVLTDVLPVEVAYLTSTRPGVCQGGVLSWTMDLLGGQAGAITVVGLLSDTAVPGTTVTNTARLSWLGTGVVSYAAFEVYQPPVANCVLYLPLAYRDMESAKGP